MRIFKSLALAVMMAFALLGTASAQSNSCMSAQAMMEMVNKDVPDAQKLDLIYLTGGPLETFAAAMDKITGGGHGPMDGLVFLNPEGNKNEVTVIAVFRDGCYVGTAEVPTTYVAKALGPNV